MPENNSDPKRDSNIDNHPYADQTPGHSKQNEHKGDDCCCNNNDEAACYSLNNRNPDGNNNKIINIIAIIQVRVQHTWHEHNINLALRHGSPSPRVMSEGSMPQEHGVMSWSMLNLPASRWAVPSLAWELKLFLFLASSLCITRGFKVQSLLGPNSSRKPTTLNLCKHTLPQNPTSRHHAVKKCECILADIFSEAKLSQGPNSTLSAPMLPQHHRLLDRWTLQGPVSLLVGYRGEPKVNLFHNIRII